MLLILRGKYIKKMCRHSKNLTATPINQPNYSHFNENQLLCQLFWALFLFQKFGKSGIGIGV